MAENRFPLWQRLPDLSILSLSTEQIDFVNNAPLVVKTRPCPPFLVLNNPTRLLHSLTFSEFMSLFRSASAPRRGLP